MHTVPEVDLLWRLGLALLLSSVIGVERELRQKSRRLAHLRARRNGRFAVHAREPVRLRRRTRHPLGARSLPEHPRALALSVCRTASVVFTYHGSVVFTYTPASLDENESVSAALSAGKVRRFRQNGRREAGDGSRDRAVPARDAGGMRCRFSLSLRTPERCLRPFQHLRFFGASAGPATSLHGTS
jgi:hypothetical protein